MSVIKTIMVVVMIATCVASYSHGQNAAPVTFTNLQQAVNFIATELDRTNFTAIIASYYAPMLMPKEYLLFSLKLLQDRNRRKPLRSLYEGKSFPTNSPSFLLGGHESELDYTHIMFIHTNGQWRLCGILECD